MTHTSLLQLVEVEVEVVPGSLANAVPPNAIPATSAPAIIATLSSRNVVLTNTIFKLRFLTLQPNWAESEYS